MISRSSLDAQEWGNPNPSLREYVKGMDEGSLSRLATNAGALAIECNLELLLRTDKAEQAELFAKALKLLATYILLVNEVAEEV